jgi:collagen type VII alpha
VAYTQDFFTSRRNYGDGDTRIGELGRLWYDPITNTIRVSDGVTPGGIIVTGGGGGGTTTIVSATAPGIQPTGTLWWNTTDGNLYVSYQGTWVDASAQYVLAAATTSTLGGVKIGAGITVTPDGTISVTGVSGNGYTGSQGNTGYTGSAGIDGVIGYIGSIGYTGSSSAAIVSDTNPGTEATGTFWWNTIDGNLYINYQNTWVDAVAQYVLSTATTSTLGGVKIGSGISITADGTISVTGGAGNGYTGSAGINGISGYTGSAGIDGVAGYTGSIGYTGSSSAAIVSDTNPGTESTGTLWWNSVDGNLYINYQNTWVDAVSQFVLTTATTSTLGGVKIGSGISITADGTISVTGGSGNGYTGSAGTSGINGYTGSAGVDGSIGYVGSIGYIGSSSAAIVSDTNPGVEATGTFWWNSIDGNLYINYQNTWVDAVSQFVLTTATTSTLGGVKIGSGINITSDGTISVTGGSGNGYTGSAGTSGINGYTGSIGTGYTGSAGVDGILGYVGSIGYVGSVGTDIVSDTNPGTESTGTLWWNSVDGNLYINYQNTWVDAVSQFVLTTATTSTLGGVKIGSGINISGDGTISSSGLTSQTPSLAKTTWNAAIDTEISLDNYRLRVHNSTGNFPEIISNTGGTVNTAWTAVAAISGQAITQTGNTGILLPNGTTWTQLYTSHGLDSSGDTITVTLQDKSAGKIYRITYMRSDSGTVGYNIIAERLL